MFLFVVFISQRPWTFPIPLGYNLPVQVLGTCFDKSYFGSLHRYHKDGSAGEL